MEEGDSWLHERRKGYVDIFYVGNVKENFVDEPQMADENPIENRIATLSLMNGICTAIYIVYHGYLLSIVIPYSPVKAPSRTKKAKRNMCI